MVDRPEPARADRAWLLLVPVCLVAIAHGGALSGGFTNWDDPMYLLQNPLTADPLARGLGGLLLTESIGYSVPLTVLGYAAQRALFDLSPTGFHAVSLIVHAAVVLGAAHLARRLGARWLGAAAAASLLAVHPLVVEPVAWVVGQKDLWAALFLIAALIVRAGPDGARPSRAIAAVALVALSLAAKPSTVGAPLLLVGIDLLRDRPLRANLAVYVATTALALAATALALWGHDGAPADAFGPGSLAEAGWAFTLQLRHLVAPIELTARYFAPGAIAIPAVLGVVAAALTVGGALVAWRRGHRAAAFGILAALVAYAPTSGIAPLTRGPADSYMYLPLALACAGLASPLGALLASPGRRGPAVALLAAVLVLFTLRTRAQVPVWTDAPALWEHVAEAYPHEPRAVVRLGDAYLFVDRPAMALAAYEQVRQLDPDFTAGLISQGIALDVLGRSREAERVLAEGARRGELPVFRERYGFFLLAHETLEPSDPGAARAALVHIAPLLARHGKRPAGLERAASLLERYREPDWARRLRERLAEVRARR